jgi:hypothetical protein
MTATTPQDQTRYNVVCKSCNNVLTPKYRSPLWWKAKQRADKGFLDAHYCTGIECGCEQERYKPNAPFRVFGYTDDCQNFDIPFDIWMLAVKKFKSMHDSGGYVVFINGISDTVRQKIMYGR